MIFDTNLHCFSNCGVSTFQNKSTLFGVFEIFFLSVPRFSKEGRGSDPRQDEHHLLMPTLKNTNQCELADGDEPAFNPLLMDVFIGIIINPNTEDGIRNTRSPASGRFPA
jgi:hypothetical protein